MDNREKLDLFEAQELKFSAMADGARLAYEKALVNILNDAVTQKGIRRGDRIRITYSNGSRDYVFEQVRLAKNLFYEWRAYLIATPILKSGKLSKCGASQVYGLDHENPDDRLRFVKKIKEGEK